MQDHPERWPLGGATGGCRAQTRQKREVLVRVGAHCGGHGVHGLLNPAVVLNAGFAVAGGAA